MRLRIRYQFLVPLLTLLLGVIAMSTWTALASAARARQQLDDRMDNLAASVRQANFPYSDRVLKLMKGLSGADFVLVQAGQRRTTLASADFALPADFAEDGRGQRIVVGDT